MKCPECGWGTDVKDSRYVDAANAIRRRRTCRNGHAFVSWEVVAGYGAFAVTGRGKAHAIQRLDVGALRDKVMAEVTAAFDGLMGSPNRVDHGAGGSGQASE